MNRGWVPLQLADPKARVGGQVTGTLKILGLLRSTEKVSYFYCFHNICIKMNDFHKWFCMQKFYVMTRLVSL